MPEVTIVGQSYKQHAANDLIFTIIDYYFQRVCR